MIDGCPLAHAARPRPAGAPDQLLMKHPGHLLLHRCRCQKAGARAGRFFAKRQQHAPHQSQQRGYFMSRPALRPLDRDAAHRQSCLHPSLSQHVRAFRQCPGGGAGRDRASVTAQSPRARLRPASPTARVGGTGCPRGCSPCASRKRWRGSPCGLPLFCVPGSLGLPTGKPPCGTAGPPRPAR